MYAVEKASSDNLRKFPTLTHYVVSEEGEVVRGCASIHIAMNVCRELNENSPWYQEWRKTHNATA